jgi:hypothetical protein
MALLVAIEGGRASDMRLRRALPPLAGFGLVHAAQERMEGDVCANGPSPTNLELSIKQMQGSMSQKFVKEPAVFERANDMKVLGSFWDLS